MSNIRTIHPGLVQRLALCLHEGAYICKSLGIVVLRRELAKKVKPKGDQGRI
jgi:hypothetical protein